jgi:hypothetical protein
MFGLLVIIVSHSHTKKKKSAMFGINKQSRMLMLKVLGGGTLLVGALVGFKYVTGGYVMEERTSDARVEHVRQNLLRDYAPFTVFDDNEGKVDCDPKHLILHDCDLDSPVESCKHCKGQTTCQRFTEDLVFSLGSKNKKKKNAREIDAKNIAIKFSADTSKGKCLPSRNNKKFRCNPYSGQIVLAKRGDEAIWLCTPKYPELVNKSILFR